MQRRSRLLLTLAAASVVALVGPAIAARKGATAKAPRLTVEQIAERKAKAEPLLQAWLAAQNRGDFDAYMGLYAPRFRGVRRSGLRTVRLDRPGWEKDRRRMFGKPMTVKLEHVQIMPGQNATDIVFTQHWASGNYSDVGPKRIRIAAEADGVWKIVFEEMLASHPPGEMRVPALAPSGQFAFVYDGEIVLAEGGNLCDGVSDVVDADMDYVIRCPVKAVSVPKELESWKGAAVTVFAASGEACHGKVAGFSQVGRAYVMPGIDEELQSSEGTASRRVQAAIWGDTTPLLVATVTGCEGVEQGWARLSSLPRPPRATVEPIDDVFAGRRRAAFHALEGWAPAQAQCGQDGPWEDGAEVSGSTADLRIGQTRRRFVSLFADTGTCSAECARLSGLFEVTKGGLVPLKGEPGHALLAVFDADGDGEPEFLYRGESGSEPVLGLWTRRPDGAYAMTASAVLHRWHGCAC